MKLLTLKTILLLSLALLPASLFAQCYVWQSLSPQDAIQAVRSFEGNSTLPVAVEPPNAPGFIDTNPTMYDSSDGYSLNTTRYIYNISKYTQNRVNRIDRLFYTSDLTKFYGAPYDITTLSQKVMSKDAATSIAVAFMQSHYPYPTTLTLGRVNAHYALSNTPGSTTSFLDYYTIGFYQTINNVLAPSYCTINVDTVLGQVINYSQSYYPVMISTTPLITNSQAMAVAINSYIIMPDTPRTVITNPDSTSDVYITRPDAMGLQTLAYDVQFDASASSTDMAITYIATVDANTGNVLAWDELESLSAPIKRLHSKIFDDMCVTMSKRFAKQNFLSFSIDGKIIYLDHPILEFHMHPYMDISYLSYHMPGAKISIIKGTQIMICEQTHNLKLQLNSLDYQINGHHKRMSGKSVLINGYWYVPLDVMQTVIGGKWSYDAKAQTIHFDPPQRKVARNYSK